MTNENPYTEISTTEQSQPSTHDTIEHAMTSENPYSKISTTEQP